MQWLWQTLDLFTNEEKILFLRFVSGRSRLPTRVSEIPQRFQVMKGQVRPVGCAMTQIANGRTSLIANICSMVLICLMGSIGLANA